MDTHEFQDYLDRLKTSKGRVVIVYSTNIKPKSELPDELKHRRMKAHRDLRPSVTMPRNWWSVHDLN